jgi:predicted acyltransferase
MSKTRLGSIDVFRAVTMYLMVFVNDLDPIPGVPEWIKHVGRNTDGLGFADTIFPAFLFIVGLSIPLSLDNRAQKIKHVLLRGLALLVMGFFHVNLESYDGATAVLSKPVWEIGITVAFFAIWLDYPSGFRFRRVVQGAGVLLLGVLALLYKGTEGPLAPHWWGILGLIGWSYLLCAGVYLLAGGRFWVLCAATAFFLLFNIAVHAHWLTALDDIRAYVWVVGNGSMPALTMAGVVVLCWYRRARHFLPGALIAGAGCIALGFALRSLGGISKLHDTPAWVLICTGLSTWTFALLTWLIDQKGKAAWFTWLKPAGTSTLTCYLVPYLLYSVYMLFHFTFPPPFNAGTGGLIKSLVTAAVVVGITGLLQRARLRLKI